MDEISQNTTSGPSLDRAERERDRAIIESYHEDFGVQEPSGVGLLASLLSLVTRIPTLDLLERVDADPDLQQELLDGYRAKSFEWIRQRGKPPSLWGAGGQAHQTLSRRPTPNQSAKVGSASGAARALV